MATSGKTGRASVMSNEVGTPPYITEFIKFLSNKNVSLPLAATVTSIPGAICLHTLDVLTTRLQCLSSSTFHLGVSFPY